MSRDDDPVTVLSSAALVLESRKWRDGIIEFPDSEGKYQAVSNAINYGGTLNLDELGGMIYYLADIMDNIDNWKTRYPSNANQRLHHQNSGPS